MSKKQLIDIKQENKQKTAILISVMKQKDSEYEINRSLDELCRLAETAEIVVFDKCFQKREKPDPATYVGLGFLNEIKAKAIENDIDLLIFDNELTPAQIAHIEKKHDLQVIDRTELILNIFYKHAKTNEARLEIRLAELHYEKPRLRNNSSGLDRLGGASGGAVGLAARGSGETKLELDKRSIEKEIMNIKQALKKIEIQKETQAKMRSTTKKVCLVGYTNAGKSTLFNTLTDSDVYVKDQLFATLTSTSRQLNLFPSCEVVLSDTVGFISKLPHQLVASFNATLKEVKDADLLLHVVDISDKDYDTYINEVNKVLHGIGVAETPTLLVFNKIDKCDFNIDFILKQFAENTIPISAANKINVDTLKNTIKSSLFITQEYKLYIPFSEQKLIANLHEKVLIVSKEFDENGIVLVIQANVDCRSEFEKWTTFSD